MWSPMSVLAWDLCFPLTLIPVYLAGILSHRTDSSKNQNVISILGPACLVHSKRNLFNHVFVSLQMVQKTTKDSSKVYLVPGRWPNMFTCITSFLFLMMLASKTLIYEEWGKQWSSLLSLFLLQFPRIYSLHH